MLKTFEDFSEEDGTKVSWDALEKIGDMFHSKIMKSPLKEFYLDSAASEYEDEARNWDITDNGMKISDLDIEFHFYFNKFTVTDFYLEDMDKKINEFKKSALLLRNMFKGLRVRIHDVNAKYGQDTEVTVVVTTKDLNVPEIKNIISSVDGIDKYDL